MFEKNLQDLVKGIRSTKGDVSVYISQAMAEIKAELKSTDPFIKANAVRKLTYLHMLGYDMCWAAFHVVEVMSYERFVHKRIGYTAACQSFTQSTDVVLLCTNLLKKEFGSVNEYEVGLAINVLSNIVTTDLARDLLGDVVSMMNSHKAYVRKKATLALYKMFLRYPQGLRLTFDKLKERMEEPEVAVVSCAVNVICELANKKPRNYLGLAPHFFRLLTTSSNNWMLIKVVKLLASLVPEEPRLARKLLDPLATVIQNTPAKSLLYECISTVTTALLYTKKSDGSQPRNVPAIVRLCNDHLRRYIEDPDQNLRYLGLVGLGNLMLSHPYVISEHQAIIIECLAVDDVTIRMRSLELLVGMVTPDNAAPIVRELMRQTLSADGAYRHELIARILHVCSVNKYENIHDFDWYIHVLVQLARVPSGSGGSSSSAIYTDSPTRSSMAFNGEANHGVEVARQLVDIAVRVKSVRSVLVENMIALLMEKDALTGPGASTLSQVFYAAAWISGEYVMEYLDDVDDEDEDEDEDDEDRRETEEEKLDHIEELVDQMLQPKTTSLPGHVQAVFVQTLLKFVNATAEKADENAVEQLADMMLERLPAFIQSEHVDVQERAVCLQQILLSLGIGFGSLSAQERASRAFDSATSVTPAKRVEILNGFFTERLAPVGSKAQRKVPLPGDLDLDAPISSSEASFLESGGDVGGAFSNEDDLEVSFVSQSSQGFNGAGGYSGIGDDDMVGEKKSKKKSSKSKRRGHRNGGASSSEDASDRSSGEASDSEAERARRQREYELEQKRLRSDPFYLASGGNSTNADANNPLGGFAEIMDALDATKKQKKKSKTKSKKSRAIFEDELMPDGASDDERQRNKSKGFGNDDIDLAAVDLSIPLGENEKIPDEHLYHRQTRVEPDSAAKSSKKHKKSKKHRDASDDEDDHKKSKKKSKDKNKSADEPKSSKKKHSRSGKESKENLLLNMDEESGDKRKSSKKSSKRADKDGESKSKKSSKDKKKSSKHHEKQQQDEPLLLF